MSYLPQASRAVAQVRSADRWISRIAAVTVAGLTGVAGALSYSHMLQLAQDHGQAGWHAHAFPLSVDGVEIVASLVLLADRRAGRRPGWLPWTALAAGTAGSLAANIAVASPGPVSRIIAGWPALALLIAVKLLTGLLEHPGAPDARAAAGDLIDPAIDPAAAITPIHGMTLTSTSDLLAESHLTETRTDSAESRVPQPTSPPIAVGEGLDSRAVTLLAAAQAARDELRQNGFPLTRDTLATRLRQHGHPIRNDRITPLLRYLRDEPPHEHQLDNHRNIKQTPAA